MFIVLIRKRSSIGKAKQRNVILEGGAFTSLIWKLKGHAFKLMDMVALEQLGAQIFSISIFKAFLFFSFKYSCRAKIT